MSPMIRPALNLVSGFAAEPPIQTGLLGPRGEFAPLFQYCHVSRTRLLGSHLSLTDIHEHVLEIRVAVYPVEHLLHLLPCLHLFLPAFPALENFRVWKFVHSHSSSTVMARDYYILLRPRESGRPGAP